MTLSQMFRPQITTEYPKEHRVKPQRFHGRHVLNRYPDGMEKCIGCELCANLPGSLHLRAWGRQPPGAPVSPGERYGHLRDQHAAVHLLRLCVRLAPPEAITMSQLFEMSTTNRGRRHLHARRSSWTPRHRSHVPLRSAGRPVRAATARWAARATAPSGRVAYSGVAAWTPVAGIGLLPLNRRRIGRTTTTYRRRPLWLVFVFRLPSSSGRRACPLRDLRRVGDCRGVGGGVLPERSTAPSGSSPRWCRWRSSTSSSSPIRGDGPGNRLRRGGAHPVPLRDHVHEVDRAEDTESASLGSGSWWRLWS